jgi:hypothetical protein
MDCLVIAFYLYCVKNTRFNFEALALVNITAKPILERTNVSTKPLYEGFPWRPTRAGFGFVEPGMCFVALIIFI